MVKVAVTGRAANVLAAGAGGPYTFSVDGSGHVNGCKDTAGAVAGLSACLDAAAYSSAFGFGTDRVIFK